MYKGKFDQKNKQSSAGVEELLAQRSKSPATPPERPVPRQAPASDAKSPVKRESPAPVKPAAASAGKPTPAGKPAPAKAPASGAQTPRKPAAAPEPVKKQKKGPRLGGVIFYTLYFLFILVFFVGTYIGLQWLQGWLTDFEAAQPTVKAEQVFTQLFTDPQWADLYEASGVQDTAYEGKDQFVTYMNNKVGDSKLSYLETSAGLSGDKKYVVRLGNEKVASFTLVDKNSVGDTTLENLGELPDWQLGAVEVFFERDCSYLIEKVNGHTAYVNNVPLSDDNTIQIATTVAEKYLPAGTTGVSMCLQEVSGLFAQPTVTVFDEKGNQMEVTYDEATRTFTERTESNTITQEQEDVVINAAKTNCLWMIKEVTDRGTVAKYFDTSSDAYTDIVKTTELWMQSHGGYEFADVSVTNFSLYNDEIFSARISLTLKVTRNDGTVKDYPFAKSMFFHKNDSGKWLCFVSTNVDISQPVGKVRLTFMNDQTKLTSDFYETDAEEIITPIITPVPEGKVFAGWITIGEDETGSTVYTLVFQPDETGRVAIPEGTTLEPMTLYAYFEDAGAAAETQSTEGA
ncbi:MAG: hypothetical protein SPD81_11385 [Candidatus Faecousia sp.]|nr:hypothetical protein [Candidatus Faecousia sp.]